MTVSPAAAGVEGSSIYLVSGEKISMNDLLYGLMLASGNDAAVAIAEHVGGSVDGFAELMNREAAEIGVRNTSFKNPNGLDAEGHFTTAHDLAVITRAALSNPRFCEIVSSKSRTLSESDVGYKRYLTNHNKLLSRYKGCIGVKTGFTKKTGRCLVSAAERDGMRLIAVTLSAPDDWNDHTSMLDFAFSENIARPVTKKGMIIKTIPVTNGDSDFLSLVAGEDYNICTGKNEGLGKIRLYYNVPTGIKAPVTAGSVVGTLCVYYGSERLKEIPLTAEQNVAYVKPPAPSFYNILKKFFSLGLQKG